MTGPRPRQMAVPLTPPPRRRQPPMLLVVGGLALAAVVVLVFLFLGGGGGPSPSPSGVAGVSPTPSASASLSGSPSSSVGPSITPALTPTPDGSVEPAPTSTSSQPMPSGGQLVDAPTREVVFTSLGIDNPAAPEATERQMTFTVDGEGQIDVEIADITAGLVKMCLWPGDGSTSPAESDCVTTPDSQIKRRPESPGQWTISLLCAQPGRSPAITLLIRFPATEGNLILKDIRFQGQDSPNYTGFDMKVTARADGELVMNATWDDGLGTNYPYTLSILDLSVEFEEPLTIEGVSHQAAATRQVIDEHTYQITITNLQEEIIEAVFLGATLTWP